MSGQKNTARVKAQLLTSARGLLAGLLVIAALTGCAYFQPGYLPPIPPDTGNSLQNGNFVWVDLITEDVAASASFYSRLFQWRAAKLRKNSDYYLFYLNGKPVAGMVAATNTDFSVPESLWLPNMAVSNVDQVAARAKANGGTVLEGPLNAPGRGRMALIGDSAGAALILVQADGLKAKRKDKKVGQLLWTELVTRNAGNAEIFYGATIGFQTEQIETGKDLRYTLFKLDGHALAGVVELDWNGLQDNWLPYFKVADVDKTIDSARDLGGFLILKSGDAAVIADPTGAAFGIQKQ